MECAICQVRSSVGYCAECQILLCDECGISCSKCGKLVCSQHVQETRSHKRLCSDCMEERKARAAEKMAAAEADDETSLAALQAEEDVSDEALVGSIRQPPPPWKLSAVTGGAGVLVMIVLLIFPPLRHVDMPGTGAILFIPYVLMIVPLIAIIWSVIGFVGADYEFDRPKAGIGLALAVLAIILGVYAVKTDPKRTEADKARLEAERLKSATPDEIKEKREGVLNRFK